MQLELNAIYNALAPGRLTQFKHNYIPYYNLEIKEEIRVCNNMLTKAIESNSQNDWRGYRNKKSYLNKEIKRLKSVYLKSKLTEKNYNWKFIKKYNKQEKSTPPGSLIVNGTYVTSPRQMANIANNFLISKIEAIRNTFTQEVIGPMDIVKELCPRVEENFSIPLITIKQTIQLINSAKKFKFHWL